MTTSIWSASIDSLCLNVTSGGTPFRRNEEFWANGTIPWVKTGELKDCYIYDAEEKITEAGLVGSSAKVFPINTVLMAMYGDGKTITSLGIVKNEVATNQACCAMIANPDKCDYRYLYYALMHHRHKLLGLVIAGAQRNLSIGIIKRFNINTFSLKTQQKIASVLSAYDDLIENNRRRIELLEQAAQLLYKEWFVHLRFPGHEHVKIVDGVPEGWEKKTISDICDTVGGGTPSTKVLEYWEGDITWIVPSDITKNDCLALLDSERKITDKGLRKSSAKMVPAETILMTSRASVGFFALMDYEVCTNQGFINIIPHEDELRMYLLFNLMSRVTEIRSNAKGTTYPEISKGRFRKMEIVVPSKTLASEFAQVATDNIQQVRYLKRMTLQLTKARDLLLPRLMNGEVAV